MGLGNNDTPGMAEHTILLVDDEQMILEPISVMLTRYGYNVICANSGMEAIGIVDKGSFSFDAIVLDMLMPGLNGQETFQQIRQILPETPVLFASGFYYSDQIDWVMKNGCDGFIQKPYRASALHTEIQKCLCHKATQQ